MQNETTEMDSDLIEVDWSQVTPYEVMRNQNCKTARYLSKETYPSIRPPVSACSNAQTMEWLADAVEENGCSRPFGLDLNDDVLEVWKQSPNKHTLAFYGINSEMPNPEATRFNEVVSECLDKVNGKVAKSKKQKCPKSSDKKKKVMKQKGPFVLNRCELKSMINKMPTVQRKLNSKSALCWLHAPEPEDPEYPFLDDDVIPPSLNSVLGIQKPARKPKKHGLRRKNFYCDLQCGIAENKCTQLEWMKYREDPLPYEVAFQMELNEMRTEPDPEPRNYDELYNHLLGCFEKCWDVSPDCKTYGKCCRLPSERRVIQGCAEYDPNLTRVDTEDNAMD